MAHADIFLGALRRCGGCWCLASLGRCQPGPVPVLSGLGLQPGDRRHNPDAAKLAKLGGEETGFHARPF